jgi:hypothetical protein
MKPLLILLTASLLLAAGPDGVSAQQAKKPVIWPDCYCVNRGGVRHELGELVCLYVDGRSFLARCEMSLNNPSWKEIADFCPAANLTTRPELPRSAPVIWPS